jgi:hypothetical protein
MRFPRAFCLCLMSFVLAAGICAHAHAQAALFMEDADGFSRAFDPTGHVAVYFARICAESPTRLRRCRADEPGVVISRYKGIAGYDWLAVPLIPYLYSVEDASEVPARVNRETVQNLRMQYRDAHLRRLGQDVPEGGRVQRGWNQLLGSSYERRIYAFRFNTSADQDDAFIAKMNAGANRSHFNILLRNCADFSGSVLDFYFPHTFRRRIVPDAGVVTPRQVAYELVRYAGKHHQIQLKVMEIPLVPGYHYSNRLGKSAAESLVVSGYVVPIAFLSPYAAGVIVVDDLIWGRYPLGLVHPQVLSPERIAVLAAPADSNLARKMPDGEGLEASTASKPRR